MENQNNQVEQPNVTLQSILNEVKESGLTPQELFYKKVKEMGIDPMTILNQVPPQFR